jgi:predicted NBD/HSP70 family sugar kinase
MWLPISMDSALNTAAIRSHNLRAVLDALRNGRPASRAELASRTGLSKPTVAGALRTFEASGLVREFGRTTGRRGPSASLYNLEPEAVLVLAIDVGARYVRSELADLDGRAVDEVSLRLSRPSAADVLEGLRELRARVGDRGGRIAATVVGTPGVIDPESGRITSAPNIDDWEGLLAEAVLSDVLGTPVRVENDVNLAALGEQASGRGRGIASFAYLNIGTGLGAGIILDGRLHRGAHGAAGEIGYLPIGPDPLAPEKRAQGGPMETRLSSQGLAEAAVRLAAQLATDVPKPFDIQTLFDGARTGDPLGRAVVAHAALEIATCVAAITSIVDLDLVLVGGGIGASDELLLPDVRTTVAKLVPIPPQIERAALGERGVRAGAIAVALDDAYTATVRSLMATGAADGHT